MLNSSIFKILIHIWSYIHVKRRWQLILLVFLTILSAFSEIISLSSALPFVSVITSPDKVFSFDIVLQISHFFGITTNKDLIILLSILFGLSALLAGVFRLVLMKMSIYLGNTIGMDFGVDIYRKTLYQPYRVHVSRSSSEIISGITQKVGVTTSVMISVVNFFTTMTLFIAIIGSLFFINPIISSITVISFGFLYGVMAWNTKYKLVKNSQIISMQQNLVIRSLQEGLGAIRDILLDGLQDLYSNNYYCAILKQQIANSENTFINQAPRYVMETCGMILIALLVLILNGKQTGLLNIAPIMGVLALGAQRLLPLMQQIYGSWSLIIGSKSSLIDVLNLLKQPLPLEKTQYSSMPMQLNKAIYFKNVSFSYTNDSPVILDQLNFSIPKGAKVGVLGMTGCGKSTMLDILMGLLEPTHGELIVDNQVINIHNIRSWQQSISHVPQMIFLLDATIAENIAFGVPYHQIDYERLCKAAKLANAHDFIFNLHNGYNALVGERGIRLSGGQRQRIGIARALYKQATVLCFDEATSALDNSTENEVMKAVDNLDSTLTVIIIAHRLTTLRNCTHFIKLVKGKVHLIETYEELELNFA